MYALLREKASYYESSLVRFTKDLIDTPATRLIEEDHVGESVLSEFETLGYDKAFKDSFGNVIGCIYGREYSPTLLLVSHMDTIHSFPENAKKSPAVIKDDILYGHGASDSKSGLAAQVYAGRLVKECFPMNGNLIVVASIAEQGGCSIGIRHFLKDTLPSLGLKPSFAILGEPTDLGLYYGHEGWVCIEIKISGHSDEIQLAAEQLNSFLNKSTANTLPDVEHIEEISISNPQYSGAGDQSRALIQIMHRLRNKNEIFHLLCRFRETARYICKPFTNISTSVGIGRRVMRKRDGSSLVVRQISLPWSTDPLNPYFEEARLALRAADCVVRGGTWHLGHLGMGTAGNVLTELYGIPTIGYGPGTELATEGTDEFVSLSNLKEAFYGTAVIIHRITAVPTVIKKD